MSVLKQSEIEEIEIDLTGSCNLKCYICTRNFKHAQHIVIPYIRPLNEISDQLNTFSSLKRIMCAGTMSEPTLYPQFFEFIEYLNSRNIIYEIFTNGNTHNETWWRRLGQIVNEQSKVVFTICGSTQELHEYYRVGSNLNQILVNAAAYRENKKKNDWCQHILFEYNKDDQKNMYNIYKQFSNCFSVHSEGRRRLNSKINECPIDIRPLKKIEYVQNMIFSKIPKLNSNNVFIECQSYKCKKLYMNQFGKISYCFTHAEFENHYLENLDVIDFSDVENYNYYDCFLCSKYSRQFMDKCNFSFIC